MRTVLIIVSVSGLALTVLPALLVVVEKVTWQEYVLWMGIGTVAWFAAAPFWLRSTTPQPARTELHPADAP